MSKKVRRMEENVSRKLTYTLIVNKNIFEFNYVIGRGGFGKVI
jgi:hypothetical protein